MLVINSCFIFSYILLKYSKFVLKKAAMQLQVGTNREFVVFPEYVIYRASYYMEPHLSFSQASVKVEVSTAHGKERSFTFECSVDDIVTISCQCFNKVSNEKMLLKCFSLCPCRTNAE